MSDKAKVRIGPLITIGGVLTEMSRVYREMRRGELDGQQGERLVRSLTAIRQGIEGSNIEQRLTELEKQLK